MAPTVENVKAKLDDVEIDPKAGSMQKDQTEEVKVKGVECKAADLETEIDMVGRENEMKAAEEPKVQQKDEEENVEADNAKDCNSTDRLKVEAKKDVPLEVEPKTGVAFPVELDDGKQLNAVGLRKKSMLGMGIKIYSFGMYADNEKLKTLLKSKIAKPPAKPTEEMYRLVIDSDVEMMVRLVIVFSGLTMNMIRKNFDEGLGASIKKLTGGKKNDELAAKVMGQASDDIKLTSGSVIEITRLPGFVLETKVLGEVVSKIESELLCRAYIHMYLGPDCFDKEAKEKFGASLMKLF